MISSQPQSSISAGAVGGARIGIPKQSRIFRIASGGLTAQRMRIRPPQRSHFSASTAPVSAVPPRRTAWDAVSWIRQVWGNPCHWPGLRISGRIPRHRTGLRISGRIPRHKPCQVMAGRLPRYRPGLRMSERLRLLAPACVGRDGRATLRRARGRRCSGIRTRRKPCVGTPQSRKARKSRTMKNGTGRPCICRPARKVARCSATAWYNGLSHARCGLYARSLILQV